MPIRRTAAECIAFHMGYDFAEMSDLRYQSTRWISPAIYTLGNHQYCCPPIGRTLRPEYAGMTWAVVGKAYGRDIYRA